jgi:hypothetical protein
MHIPGRAIFAVYLRLRDLERRPRLFDDRMPSGRVRRRRERFRRWCGPELWQVLCNCEMKRDAPRDDVIRWRRDGRLDPSRRHRLLGC